MLGAVLFATVPLAGQQRMPLAWQRVQRLLHMPQRREAHSIAAFRVLSEDGMAAREAARSASTSLRSCCCRRSIHRQSNSFSTAWRHCAITISRAPMHGRQALLERLGETWFGPFITATLTDFSSGLAHLPCLTLSSAVRASPWISTLHARPPPTRTRLYGRYAHRPPRTGLTGSSPRQQVSGTQMHITPPGRPHPHADQRAEARRLEKVRYASAGEGCSMRRECRKGMRAGMLMPDIRACLGPEPSPHVPLGRSPRRL